MLQCSLKFAVIHRKRRCSMTSKLCAVGLLVVLAGLPGCQPAPVATTVQIKVGDRLLATGEEIRLRQGDSVVLEAVTSGAVVGYDWEVPTDASMRHGSPDLPWLFRDAGRQLIKVTAFSPFGEAFNGFTSIWVVIDPVPQPVVVVGPGGETPPVPIALDLGRIIVTGGGWIPAENLFEVEPGKDFVLDLSGACSGGTGPYAFVVTGPGGVIWGTSPRIVRVLPTGSGDVYLTIRITDGRGQVREFVILIRVRGGGNPPPCTLPVLALSGPAAVGVGESISLAYQASAGTLALSSSPAIPGLVTVPGSSPIVISTAGLGVGTYRFHLRLTNPCGSTEKYVDVVVENDPPNMTYPTVVISAPAQDATVKIGQSVTFTAKVIGGTPPYSYNWLFSDGDTPATTSSASVVKVFHRATAGQFPFDQYLEVRDSQGRKSLVATVRVRVVPQP